MKQVLFYGVPGTGKSTIGRLYATKLHLPFYELDLLRDELPPDVHDPYLRLPSTLAWKQLGRLNSRTAVDGFMQVRKALQPYVLQKLASIQVGFVAESAFIDPSFNHINSILVIKSSAGDHYSQFFVHRTPSAEADEQFKAARFIQDRLIEEATALSIRIIDNDASLDHIVATLQISLE